jgi:diaminopimelate epimerase
MTSVPFTKLHGAENDFLLTWKSDAPASDLTEVARRICARYTGIGADGWMLVERRAGGLGTRLFNSDGSEPEISGNGTRCAAAFAILQGVVSPPEVLVETVAGEKKLRLVGRQANRFEFEMDMGAPKVERLHAGLELATGKFDTSILNVGNPQCAIFVSELPRNWLAAAAEAEGHPQFPHRTNVSFVKVLDRHSLEVRFFERGAGETRSSGTGSTGAAVAAILRDVAESPIEIKTPAGTLHLRWEQSVYLTGPAEVIGEGRFLLEH